MVQTPVTMPRKMVSSNGRAMYCSSRMMTIGLMSMLPKLGRWRRTGRSSGSVTRCRKSPTVHTSRLRVSSTPNAASMENTAARISAQMNSPMTALMSWYSAVIT